MTYYRRFIFLMISVLLVVSCGSDDDSSENETRIEGNWIISELTYDGVPVQWGECGHLENMTFLNDNTFVWQLYGINSSYECIPITPPATGTWENIDNTTAELTDDDRVFQVTFTETTLIMKFRVDTTDENPEGISVLFVFLRS
ncbi:lipocalin family protein [Psychroserpens jangbogonensis]|uniref:lipocalin family protein n=1 Tax=Psychroserpens jangbogonensis TaxID=1484460 RepID=UPI00053E782E|nr:lipocalin family protein [Psychroserpens jangbogonensis]